MGGTMGRVIVNSEPMECPVCGDDFQPRHNTRGESVVCGITCSHIWGSSTKNIYFKGRSGGMKMRNLWAAGQVLSDNLGIWFTAREIHSAMQDNPRIGKRSCTVGSLSQYLKLFTNFEIDQSSHLARFRLVEPLRTISEILPLEKWEAIHATYSTDGVITE